MPNPSKPTCNFSARIDADLSARLNQSLLPRKGRGAGIPDRPGITNRAWLESMLRHWLRLSDAERAALLEARDVAK